MSSSPAIVRVFRVALAAEAVVFLLHLGVSILGFEDLPEAVQQYEMSEALDGLDRALGIFVAGVGEFGLMAIALTGLFGFSRFGRWAWWGMLLFAAAGLVFQPVVTESGLVAMLGAISRVGYGLVSGLLFHPEIAARFADRSARKRVALVAAIVTGSVATAVAAFVAIASWFALRSLPQERSVPLPKTVDAHRDSPAAEVKTAAETLANAFLAEKNNAGIAIGVTRPGPNGPERVIVTRGTVERGAEDRPVTPETLFEIGSISKTVTALLAAEAVADGVIRLDQPVAEVLPESVTMAPVEGGPVTFLDLATHHAGLPKMPENHSFSAQFRGNPYAGYTEDDLFAAISELGEMDGDGHPRRRAYQYSNLGFSLLAHATARARSESLANLHASLFERLGMKTAFFVVPEESKPLLATGHNRGFEVVHWHDGGAIIQGAGNLVCSVGDLLTWLEAHLDPPTGPGSLAEALKMTPKPQRDSGDAKLRIGLGWHLRGADPRPIVWHNGGTGGFRSFCGFVPGTGLGVVVLGNSTDDGVDSLGFILIRDLLKPTQQG